MIKKHQEDFFFKKNSLPVRYAHQKSNGVSDGIQEDMLLHWHEEPEILQYTSSGGYIYIDGDLIEPQKGDIIIINPLELHQVMWGKTQFHFNSLIVSPSIFGAEDKNLFAEQWQKWLSREMIFCHRIGNDGEISNILNSIIDEYMEEKTGYEAIIKGKLNILFGILQRKFIVSDKVFNNVTHRIKSSKRFSTVLEYIEDNYQQPLTVSMLAEKFGSCTEHFCRLFHKTTTMTPKEYITALRVMQAQKLLISSDLSITEISQEVGFTDPNYFGRVFKRTNGISPMQFRNKHNYRKIS